MGWGRAGRRETPGREPVPTGLDELARDVIGGAIEVHRELGPGFLESVYEAALAIELADRGFAVERQSPIRVQYKGHDVGEGRMDMLVERKLIVELKTVEEFAPIHTAQVLSYLKSTGLRLGLLVNFNVPRLKDGLKRIIL